MKEKAQIDFGVPIPYPLDKWVIKLTQIVRQQVTLRTGTIVFVTILAAAFRIWGLGALGFNSDEAVYSGQGAAIARDPVLSQFFPVFRAHPLLFQFLLSLVFQFSVVDWLARLVSVIFGVATVYLTYRLGELLYGEMAGISAALLLALMPYHVIVTRQVLLDGPMTFFAALTFYLIARFSQTQRPMWLYASGAALGLTFLAKETGILFAAAVYAFLALSPELRLRLRDLGLATVVMALVMLPYPLSVVLSGGGGSQNTGQYLIWQFFRRPNHTWTFYLETVPLALGPLVIALAVIGLWFLRKERSWRENLLLSWILLPAVFFQVWPTKGFHYLIALAPPIAVLAGRTLGRWFPDGRLHPFGGRWRLPGLRSLAFGVAALSLLVPTLRVVYPSSSARFLAGSGGVPGGRETGYWIRDHIPKGSTLMTIGPSMANVLQFYGYRRAYGVSVSPNPLYRNPSYQPVRNPDYQIRQGEIQYLVWDAFSANRSSFFSEKLLGYVQKYNGRVVHVESVLVESANGEQISEPVIIIYQVRP